MTTKPPPLVYADARDDLNVSAANKERLALNHFNFFLQTYCPQIGIDVVVADDIPYRGLPKIQQEQQTGFRVLGPHDWCFRHLYGKPCKDRV